jgi:hypothetical protein
VCTDRTGWPAHRKHETQGMAAVEPSAPDAGCEDLRGRPGRTDRIDT